MPYVANVKVTVSVLFCELHFDITG